MKTLLFPLRYQKAGWIIFAICFALGVYIMISDYSASYLLNNVAIIGTIVGGVLATCSREKIEDEMTQQLRLNSLLMALYINYGLLIVASLVVYDLKFLNVMLYNMFTILLIFMAVFRYKIWRMKKGVEDEQ